MNWSSAPRRVFERLADDYRARPPYPDRLVERLSELAGDGRTVVDLGAGTGLLAAPLARQGHPVVAVEPARAMLAVCSETCSGLPVRPVLAPAESTGLGAVGAGLVLLADAVHWVRPDAAGSEARRLLAPDGVAAVLVPEPMDTP
ncbi:MAG TPA: methyltransferase domain-containing protein, partial [Myxococcaceae bacterium]|nr:methyltransferase domain-containing protein [Myxococcaceae bacterium]